MTRSKKFADAVLDMIMSADDDVQQELRTAYDELTAIRTNKRFAVGYHVLEACQEAFEMIDEANADA